MKMTQLIIPKLASNHPALVELFVNTALGHILFYKDYKAFYMEDNIVAMTCRENDLPEMSKIEAIGMVGYYIAQLEDIPNEDLHKNWYHGSGTVSYTIAR